MKPLAKITSKDVTFFLSPAYMIDDILEGQFGQPIEERVRRVPFDLVYLTAKFGIVPKWLLIDFLRVSCSVGQDVADQLVEEALELKLITELVPEGDKRHRLYGLTEDQLTKLRNVQKGTIMAYQMALIQGQKPDDPTHGKTEQNKSWYRNAMEYVLRRNEKYDEIMARLKAIRHLLMVLIVFAMLMYLQVDPAFATFSGAGANI